jgi:transcriptional repressor NrdR
MQCPFCLHENSLVKDSRETDDGKVIRRRRLCTKCNKKFTTFERIQSQGFMVVKRSGVKKLFDADKVKKSITTALRKRNVTDDKINEMVRQIVTEIESSGVKEATTRKIGELIMKELAKIDQVAYIRFASVYKDFSSAQDFARFINKIKP